MPLLLAIDFIILLVKREFCFYFYLMSPSFPLFTLNLKRKTFHLREFLSCLFNLEYNDFIICVYI